MKEADREIELMRLKLEYKKTEQADRRQFWTTVFTAVMSVLGPILFTIYHVRTGTKIEEVQSHAAEAAVEAKEVKKELVQTKKEEEQQRDRNAAIALKTNVDLNKWKASYTKSPEDIQASEEAEQMFQKIQSKVGSPVLLPSDSPGSPSKKKE